MGYIIYRNKKNVVIYYLNAVLYLFKNLENYIENYKVENNILSVSGNDRK